MVECVLCFDGDAVEAKGKAPYVRAWHVSLKLFLSHAAVVATLRICCFRFLFLRWLGEVWAGDHRNNFYSTT